MQQPKAAQIKDYFYDALAVAKTAVQIDTLHFLDPNSETLTTIQPITEVDTATETIHSKAKNLYKEASHKLDHITPYLEPNVQPIIQKYSQLYNARVKDLHPTTSRKMSEYSQEDKFLRVPLFGIGEFNEEQISSIDNRQWNQSPIHQRPFLILKQLRDSILDGGFLFDDLYVPKYVWYQTGADIIAQDAKVMFCQNIVDLLMSLSLSSTSNFQNWKTNLSSFNLGAQKLYEQLQKQLPSKHKKEETTSHTPSIKDSNTIGSKLFGFGKSLYKSAKVLVSGSGSNFNSKSDLEAKEDPYVPWLLTLCEKSLFLEKWFEVIRADEASGSTTIPKDLKIQLETVSYFFMLVLKTFILGDLMVLLERYFKKSRETNFKIFPKNYKPNF